MPPVPPSRQSRLQDVSKLVFCKCTICLQHNARGMPVSPSTRKNHKDDDRRRQRESQGTVAVHASTAASGSNEVWASSIMEELQFLCMAPLVHYNRPLRFRNDPTQSGQFIFDIDGDLRRPNRSLHSLTNDPENRRFLRVEHRVSEIYLLVLSLGLQDDEELLANLSAMMAIVQREKQIQWNIQQDTVSQNDPHAVNTSIFFYRGGQRSRTYRCAALLGLVLQHIYRAPRRAIRAQLAGLRDLLRAVNLPVHDIDTIPRDPRTATTYYNLHPITKQYIICPACHTLYPWERVVVTDLDEPVQKRCTFKPNAHWQGPPCDAELWKEKRLTGRRTFYRPIKIFTHQPLKYWLARLLSRPEIENYIDRAAEIVPNANGSVDDIWASPCVRSLRDKNGDPFFPAPPGEGRLLFSLALDGFNPLTLKAAHTQVSSTGIWLVLLNLPKHLRYLHQNMYPAGVIPGPHKPSADEINSYLDLIVDDLLEAFHPGLFLSRTFKYSMGRLYKAMLIPLVCDMLAARQVIGQAGAPTAHDFCTVCDIDKDDVDVFDPRDWTPKNLDHIKGCAQRWKNAGSIEERERLFEMYSIRWSPLLRLPYWDSTKYAVIDAMHTLDLGLLNNHVRVLFALDVEAPSGDGGNAPETPPPTKLVTTYAHLKAYRSCINVIKRNLAPDLEVELLRYHRKVLYTFCVENKIVPNPRGEVVTGTAWLLAHHIAIWRNGPSYSPPTTDLVNLQPESEDSDIEPEGDSDPDGHKALIPVAKALLMVLSADTEANQRRLHSTATKNSLVDLCGHLSIDISAIDLGRRTAKQHLEDLTLQRLRNDHEGQYKNKLQSLMPPGSTFSRQPEPEPEPEPEPGNIDHPADMDKPLATVAKLLLAVINADTPANVKKLNTAATKNVYVAICDRLLINCSDIDLQRRAAKKQLEDLILEQLRGDSTEHYEELLQELLPEAKGPQDVVLGKEIMQVVWADMKATQTPTWVATAPPNWGTAERGKLSAAQWRVICTIHLPITLIRLWRHETGRLRLLLDHFMDLVCAVRIANMKVASPDQIKAYNHHIFKYVSNIPKLYPGQNLKPTQHMALHLGEFLQLLGPVHAYNSPFFERYINHFHHQNTNSHPGELETTFLNESCCSANLRALMEDDSEIRPLICEMTDKMQQIDKEDIRGYRLASILDPSSPSYTSQHAGSLLELQPLEQETWQQYIVHNNMGTYPDARNPVLSYRQIAVQGVCYSTSQHVYRNSVILFSDSSDPDVVCSMAEYHTLKAAFVDIIFQPYSSAPTNSFYMLVRELRPVDQQDLDPFKRYNFAGGFLCQKTGHTLKVINIKQVVSHGVLTPMTLGELGGEVYHILCVDRLMNVFTTPDLGAPEVSGESVELDS